jgi:hypothetical protein
LLDLPADEYKRPDFNEMLEKTWDLLVKYNVQKIYIDGANPSFIKGLKLQWGETLGHYMIKNILSVTIAMSIRTGFIITKDITIMGFRGAIIMHATNVMIYYLVHLE